MEVLRRAHPAGSVRAGGGRCPPRPPGRGARSLLNTRPRRRPRPRRTSGRKAVRRTRLSRLFTRFGRRDNASADPSGLIDNDSQARGLKTTARPGTGRGDDRQVQPVAAMRNEGDPAAGGTASKPASESGQPGRSPAAGEPDRRRGSREAIRPARVPGQRGAVRRAGRFAHRRRPGRNESVKTIGWRPHPRWWTRLQTQPPVEFGQGRPKRESYLIPTAAGAADLQASETEEPAQAAPGQTPPPAQSAPPPAIEPAQTAPRTRPAQPPAGSGRPGMTRPAAPAQQPAAPPARRTAPARHAPAQAPATRPPRATTPAPAAAPPVAVPAPVTEPARPPVETARANASACTGGSGAAARAAASCATVIPGRRRCPDSLESRLAPGRWRRLRHCGQASTQALLAQDLDSFVAPPARARGVRLAPASAGPCFPPPTRCASQRRRLLVRRPP